MRIAHVSDCYLPRVGGIEMHVHDLAQRQAAAGHTVTVVTSTARPVDSRAAGWVTVESAEAYGRGNKPGAIRYTRSLAGRDMVRAAEYDVVHVHASAFSPLAFLSAHDAARRGVPTAATLHSLWAQAAPLFWITDRMTGWGNLPVAWSAVSSVAADPLRRLLAGRADVAVVPNGIDVHRWEGVASPRRADDVCLVSVMRLAARKRPLELMRVLRAVRAQVPQAVRLTVDVVGDGPERARLERYLRRHRMHGWVRLRGTLSRSEIRSMYTGADLFVSASTLESFGLAALEARCAGLPVVARSGTGIEEFVTNGRDGLLLASDRAMVGALVTLAESPDARQQLRSHCRPAPRGVSWDEVLTDCDALYRKASMLQHQPVTAFPPVGRRQPAGATA